MYPESDYIQLSALQHYMFCPRQCALIYLEQQWVENRFTAEGRVLHERADSAKTVRQGDMRIVRTLPLRSARLGLSGQADVVEFHDSGLVFPVEYKRGRPKKDRCDEVQLCAQALCLEEMLAVEIAEGALFYGQKRRRQAVVFDVELRQLTETIAGLIHEMFARGLTPAAEYDAGKCDQCSMLSVCMPKSCNPGHSVREYLAKMSEGME